MIGGNFVATQAIPLAAIDTYKTQVAGTTFTSQGGTITILVDWYSVKNQGAVLANGLKARISLVDPADNGVTIAQQDVLYGGDGTQLSVTINIPRDQTYNIWITMVAPPAGVTVIPKKITVN